MNAKTLMITALAGLVATAAHALTSDEIAAALDVDPSIGTFSLSGESNWFVDSATVHKGGASMRSGAVGADYSWHYSTLTLVANVKEPCRLSLWHKVSCRDYVDYARLQVLPDRAKFCGERGWTKYELILLPGTRTVSFEFGRYNYSSGSNCAWVDDFKLEPLSAEKSTVVQVSDITCTQRTPWNGMVDIDYTVTAEDPNADIWVYPVGYDKDSNTSMAPRALTGDGVGAAVKPGRHRMTWNVTEDYPEFHSTAFTVKMTALTGAAPYMVVDLSGGVDALSYPVSYLSSVPAGGWGDEYKTTKMAFRLIPPGSFMMGSPTDENGRGSYEDLHGVILTKPFYLGVFECTQKQYELVMGTKPASYKGDLRPVEQVSYADIRGSVNGWGWPTHNQVDANSFMGRLRSKANMLFDLPTEAQWEYACRAGTSSALNSGREYSEANLREVARCSSNVNDGKGGYAQHTIVGCYKANAWGMYDMHGNVGEFCRDYIQSSGLGYATVMDPKGPSSGFVYNGSYPEGVRAVRGGGYNRNDKDCRSAYRYHYYPDAYMRPWSTYNAVGFRVSCSPVAE